MTTQATAQECAKNSHTQETAQNHAKNKHNIIFSFCLICMDLPVQQQLSVSGDVHYVGLL